MGRFIDPRTMNVGHSAVELTCQDGKKYKNPFDEHGSSEMKYDLPDPFCLVACAHTPPLQINRASPSAHILVPCAHSQTPASPHYLRAFSLLALIHLTRT